MLTTSQSGNAVQSLSNYTLVGLFSFNPCTISKANYDDPHDICDSLAMLSAEPRLHFLLRAHVLAVCVALLGVRLALANQ